MKTLKIIAIITALLVPSFTASAVNDDNNPATGKAKFSWVQEPSDPIVTGYKVTWWENGKTPQEGSSVSITSPPQTGPTTAASVVIDGFKEGVTYQAYVQAQGVVYEDGQLESSDPSETITFRYVTKLPTPKKPKEKPERQ